MTRRLAVVGYGKMGRMIERLAPEYGFTVRTRFSGQDNSGAKALTRDALAGVDVAVEFTRPDAAAENLRELANAGGAMGRGTTGWFTEFERAKKEGDANRGGLGWGAKFSGGLN